MSRPNKNLVFVAQGEWHKFTLMIMHKLGVMDISLTQQDVKDVAASGKKNIVAEDRGHEIRIRLVTDEEAAEITAQATNVPKC